MKTSKKGLLVLSGLLFATMPIVTLLPASEVHAVADTFTLTKVGNDQISVQLNGTPQVQLPNGTVVTSNTTFRVTENKTYTFVGIDGAVKVQKPFTMTTVPDTAPLLMVSPGENVKLNFESGDVHSGVKDMRYVAYNEANGQGSIPFQAWESYKTTKPWVIPDIPKQTSGTWVVKAEFKDVAGNISTGVIGRFFIDNEAPDVSINKTLTYTNKQDIDVIANISTKYKDPYQGFLGLSSNGAFQAYSLKDYSNLYKGTNSGETRNFEYALPYKLPSSEGIHKVYFKANKKQNSQLLTSDPVSKQIVYDKTAPTGKVVIEDGGELVDSNEVKLTIDSADNLSGVDKIRIFETSLSGTTKEKTIDNPSPKMVVDWTLYMGDTAKVGVEIFDKAGNRYVTESQVVTFVKLSITAFELTNNRNPGKYHSTQPFQVKKWDWDGTKEEMLKGSTIDFKLYYDLGLGQPVDYDVTGSYTVVVRTNDNSYYNIDKVKFTNADRIVNGYSAVKVPIPDDAPKGAMVLVSSDLTATKKTKTSVKSNATFGPAYVGTVGEKSLSEVVNHQIQFNEIN